MKIQKLYLGLASPGQTKVETLDSIRVDLFTKDEAKELFSELIDVVYEQSESEGEEDGSDKLN